MPSDQWGRSSTGCLRPSLTGRTSPIAYRHVLRATLTHLDAQNPTFYSLFEQHTLRQQLTTTLKTLHDIYPDQLNFRERQAFIADLLRL